LAAGALLLYRALRPAWSGSLAFATAAFTLGAESTRTIAGWPTQFVDVGLFVFSMLAWHAAARGRQTLALVALALALLCKELAVVTGVLLAFVPAPGRTRAERVRLGIGAAIVMAVWGAISLLVRNAAHLQLPRRIADSPEALAAGPLDRLAWAFGGSLKALASLPIVPHANDGFVLAAVALLMLGAIAMFVRSPEARARLHARRGDVVFGLAWFVLATATLAPIFPSWQPNRSQYGSAGAGVALVGVAGAAHPALAAALTVSRIVWLECAPAAATTVSSVPPDQGAFMDWPRLTRLQRFMRATRLKLTAAFPTLPPGAAVVQQNLPHGVEYAFGGDHALQVWYRDPAVHWMRFDVWRAHADTMATVIVQGSADHEPPVALVSPQAVRFLFAAQELSYAGRFAELLPLLDRADSLQRDPDALQYWVTSRAMRAFALVSTGHAAQADALLAPMIPLDPNDATARQVLALARAKLGRLDEAFAQLDTLRAIDAGNPATLALERQLNAQRDAGRTLSH
ncbi:MAG: hypothetical protein K8R56_08910, partial [Candidatus Eisenbacteria bacterium]|nr:hypothetical protein [Candidatus Eisenbacteria bacterium]